MNRQNRRDFDRDSKQTIRSRGEKRSHRDDSSGSSRYSSRSSRSSCSIKEREEDPIVLERRTKQIDYGKNSVAYDNYISKVPKDRRPFYLPRTPDKNVKYSRRQWDGLIKAWKLQIHNWNAKGDTDVFQGVDEWKSKDDDPILGPRKEEEEKPLTKKETTSRSFTFNWSEEVSEDEKETKSRRKVGKKE